MNSSTVSAGQQALATQYNNLRKDIIVQAGQYATTTGSSNAYVLAIDAQYTAYTAGDNFVFKTNFANTATCTINVNTLGAKTLKDVNGNTLATGSILSGVILHCIYDGTDMIVIAGLFATATNKGDVEMATDAEVVTGTDEARYVNAKQIAVIKNGTYASITETRTSAASGTYNSASTGIKSKASVINFIYNAGLNTTAKLQLSTDDASFSDLFSFAGSATGQFAFLASQGYSYRISLVHGATATSSASIVHFT